MGRRILNEALRAMVNAERRGKATVELKPISTVMSSFLKITKDRVPGAIYVRIGCCVFYGLVINLISGRTVLFQSLCFSSCWTNGHHCEHKNKKIG